MVIQAGPPFLVVHTNAAYTRLTGIDAHAAVGKPVSALLSVQGPDRLSSSMNPDAGAVGGQQPTEATAQQQILGAYEIQAVMDADANNGQRLGQSLAEAEEAGRARAAETSANVNLERLVAACGFGKFHLLHARARPHHMVGRNVTFVTKAGVAAALPPANGSTATNMRTQDDGSSAASHTSNFEGPFDFVKCRSSISPIISDTNDAATVTDNNQESHNHKNKRRKHHHNNADQQVGHHARRSQWGKDSTMPKRIHEGITHYAIQLELFDDSKGLNDKGSMSSSATSVEANLLGLTKEGLRQQRQAAGTGGQHGASQEDTEIRQHDDEDEMASETTDAEVTIAVTAVG